MNYTLENRLDPNYRIIYSSDPKKKTFKIDLMGQAKITLRESEALLLSACIQLAQKENFSRMEWDAKKGTISISGVKKSPESEELFQAVNEAQDRDRDRAK